ncbi:hypothetical protein [Nostoc sp.]
MEYKRASVLSHSTTHSSFYPVVDLPVRGSAFVKYLTYTNTGAIA